MTIRKIDSSALREFAMKGDSVKHMSEHFKCTTETVRRSLRREGLLEQWVVLRCKEHKCENCGKPSADQFCSPKCWGYAQRRVIDASLLAPHVEAGTPLLRMSDALKINRGLLRAALIRNGQFRVWAQRRYKKCTSQKAGSTSANTAFGVAITPSARSVARTDGGTNCGT
jgi:hypothetical protein